VSPVGVSPRSMRAPETGCPSRPCGGASTGGGRNGGGSPEWVNSPNRRAPETGRPSQPCGGSSTGGGRNGGSSPEWVNSPNRRAAARFYLQYRVAGRTGVRVSRRAPTPAMWWCSHRPRQRLRAAVAREPARSAPGVSVVTNRGGDVCPPHGGDAPGCPLSEGSVAWFVRVSRGDVQRGYPASRWAGRPPSRVRQTSRGRRGPCSARRVLIRVPPGWRSADAAGTYVPA